MYGKIPFIYLKILIIILLFLGVYKYNHTLYIHNNTLNSFLQTSLQLDLSERLNSPNVNPIEGTTSQIPVDSLKGKGVLIQSAEKDKLYSYPDKKSQYITKVNHISIDQTVTRLLNPIQLPQLDSILTSLLKEKEWHAEVGILYSDSIKQIYQYSNPDLSIYSSNLHTEVVYLGIENEMKVQAFIRFHPHWLLQKQGRTIFYGGIVWLFLCGLTLYIGIYRRKQQLVETDKQGEKEIVENHPQEKTIQIGKYTYYQQKGILEFENECPISIRKTQEYIVLNTLLATEDCHCSQTKLLTALGKKEEFINQLRSIVSRLRKHFKQDPHIQIILKESVYYLLIDSEEHAKSDQSDENPSVK